MSKAKKNLSQPAASAPQKPALLISELRDTLNKSEGLLVSLDGLMGLFAESERAPEYVNLEGLANGIGYILMAIRGQIKEVNDRLGNVICDGQGNVVGVGEGGAR